MISSGCRKLAKEWPAAGHGLLAEKLSTGRLVADCWPGLLRHMVFAPKLRFVSDDKLGPSFNMLPSLSILALCRTLSGNLSADIRRFMVSRGQAPRPAKRFRSSDVSEHL